MEVTPNSQNKRRIDIVVESELEHLTLSAAARTRGVLLGSLVGLLVDPRDSTDQDYPYTVTVPGVVARYLGRGMMTNSQMFPRDSANAADMRLAAVKLLGPQ